MCASSPVAVTVCVGVNSGCIVVIDPGNTVSCVVGYPSPHTLTHSSSSSRRTKLVTERGMAKSPS